MSRLRLGLLFGVFGVEIARGRRTEGGLGFVFGFGPLAL